MGFKGSEVQILSSRPDDEIPRWAGEKPAQHFIENSWKADVAQSVERVLGKDEVGSSILLVSSIYIMKPPVSRRAVFYICMSP